MITEKQIQFFKDRGLLTEDEATRLELIKRGEEMEQRFKEWKEKFIEFIQNTKDV